MSGLATVYIRDSDTDSETTVYIRDSDTDLETLCTLEIVILI